MSLSQELGPGTPWGLGAVWRQNHPPTPHLLGFPPQHYFLLPLLRLQSPDLKLHKRDLESPGVLPGHPSDGHSPGAPTTKPWSSYFCMNSLTSDFNSEQVSSLDAGPNSTLPPKHGEELTASHHNHTGSCGKPLGAIQLGLRGPWQGHGCSHGPRASPTGIYEHLGVPERDKHPLPASPVPPCTGTPSNMRADWALTSCRRCSFLSCAISRFLFVSTSRLRCCSSRICFISATWNGKVPCVSVGTQPPDRQMFCTCYQGWKTPLLSREPDLTRGCPPCPGMSRYLCLLHLSHLRLQLPQLPLVARLVLEQASMLLLGCLELLQVPVHLLQPLLIVCFDLVGFLLCVALHGAWGEQGESL